MAATFYLSKKLKVDKNTSQPFLRLFIIGKTSLLYV